MGAPHLLYLNDYYAKKSNAPFEVPYTLGISCKECASFSETLSFIDYGSGYIPSKLPTDGVLKILKLHGCNCLLYCQECRGAIYLPERPNASSYVLYKITTTGQYSCPWCKKETTFSSLFVPPACDTSFPAWEILDPIWEQAEAELLEAKHLVIVGYSFPPEDRRAFDMLRRISRKNSNLEVLVVVPTLSEGNRKRFASVFPQFLHFGGTFAAFMGLLVTTRTKHRTSLEVPNELMSFLRSILSAGATRIKGPLLGTIPLDVDLLDLLYDSSKPALTRSLAILMLGLSENKRIRDALKAVARLTIDPQTRKLCVAAIGSIPNQDSLDFLCDFLDHNSLHPEDDSGMGGFVLPQSVSKYAHVRILDILIQAPTLDFGLTSKILLSTLTTNRLAYHEVPFARALLQLVIDCEVQSDNQLLADRIRGRYGEIEWNP